MRVDPQAVTTFTGSIPRTTRKEVGEVDRIFASGCSGTLALKTITVTAGRMSNPSHVLIARSSRSSQPVRIDGRKRAQKLNDQLTDVR